VPRRPHAERRHGHRRRDRPERERDHREPLEDAEHPREDLIGGDALEERSPRDVRDASPRTTDREQREGRHGRRKHRDRGHGGAEHGGPTGERRRQPPSSDEDDRDRRADDPPGAERGVQVARRALAEGEEVDRRRDEQHVERTDDERSGRQQQHDRPCVALVGERAEAPQRRVPDVGRVDAVGRFNGCRVDRQAHHQRGTRREEHGEDGEHDAGFAAGEDQAGDDRTEHDAGSLDDARRDVRGGEVFGRPGDRRQKRTLRRTRERVARCRRRGEDVDEPHRRVEEESRGDARGGHRLDHIADEQHAIASEPIAGVGRERGDDRRRKELDHRDQPRRGGASAGVCEHQQRDPRGVLGHVEEEEGGFDADEGVVSEHRGDDAEALVHPRRMPETPRARVVASMR